MPTFFQNNFYNLFKLNTMKLTNSKLANRQYGEIETKLNSFSHITGKHQALKNKPYSRQEFFATIFNQIQAKIQQEINQSNEELAPVSKKVIAFETQKQSKEEVTVLENERTEKEHTLESIRNQVKQYNYSFSDTCLQCLVHTIIAFLALAEGYFIYQALIYSSFSSVASAVIGIAISAGLFIATEYFASYILKATTKIGKAIRLLIVSLPVFIGFYVLAIFRVSGITNQQRMDAQFGGTPIDTATVPPYAIATLSFLIFVLGLIISMKYLRTGEEKERYKEYKKLKAAQRKFEVEIQAIDKEIQKIQEHAYEVSCDAIANYETAVRREKALASIANNALQEYIQTNLRHRTDGLVPEYFVHPPAFQFTSFQHNLNNPIQ